MAEMLRNPDTTVAASGHWFRTLVLAISSLVMAWSATREADLEKQLEAAIHREVVLGDLAGAMKEYRNILAQADVPREVAARALLQTGECMEKLGRGPEAYNSYRRIENEYGDQAAMVGLARTRLAAWVGPRNLNFEEGLPGKVPPFPWTVQAPPQGACYVAELRREGCRSRTGCAVVTAPVNVPGQNGNLMQSFSAEAYRGKTVRLRAWLKLEQFFQTAAGPLRFPDAEDRAQLWLRVVRTNSRAGFSDSMDDRPVRSSEWSRAEINAEIDEDAKTIYFGVMSFGGARAWIDDISFELIGKSGDK
jgi:hypothetical protein